MSKKPIAVLFVGPKNPRRYLKGCLTHQQNGMCNCPCGHRSRDRK